jgi:HPt (histidine-containing phosphotransfer) domain-containing protein
MVAETQPSPSPLFDAVHLARYTSGDDGLQAELLELMCDQARRCLGLMNEARDRVVWRTATHTLKGAARGVGAFALADVCEAVEEWPETAWPGARLMVASKFRETEDALPR